MSLPGVNLPYTLAMDRLDALRKENNQIASALCTESERLTKALDALVKIVALPKCFSSPQVRDLAREGLKP